MVRKTTGTAHKAKAVVVKGKNIANVNENSELKCTAGPNRKEIDQCGV